MRDLMTSLNFGTQLAEHASEHMTAARLLIASAILTASAHAAVELTSVKDWKKQVKGKNAFVKFLAPW